MPGQGVATDSGILRERTQRLLQSQVSREAGVGQLESGGDDRGVGKNGTDRRTQKCSVDGPILRIKLVQVLALLQLNSVIGVEAGSHQRVGVEAPFECQVIVVEI